MWSKVQERTREGKANKEKEDFRTILSGYLHSALGDIFQHQQYISSPYMDWERSCWFLVHITKKFSINICSKFSQLKNISWLLSNTAIKFLYMETGKSISGNGAMQTRILRILPNTTLTLLFYCYVNACPNTAVTTDIITLAFIVLHSHSFQIQNMHWTNK